MHIERAMWLSSFHLTNSSETSYMDFSWFYRRMGKYYAEEDNRTLRHQFTLETGLYIKDELSFFKFKFLKKAIS